VSPVDPELPHGHALAENWTFTRDLSSRVTELEKWRAASDAVALWRRWVLPVALSAIALTVTVLNFLFPRQH
jgi:hypothetical protein